jgi:hypothetical protein
VGQNFFVQYIIELIAKYKLEKKMNERHINTFAYSQSDNQKTIMKFGQSWKSACMSLPDRLRSHVINYKIYKKETKWTTSSVFLDKLQRDVKSINHFWKCALKSLPTEILLSFIKLNKTCLYKICKRADKRFHTNIFLEWHGQYKAGPLSGIFGNFIQKKIEYQDLHLSLEMCPICLDEECKNGILMYCGHVVCVDCLKEMLGVQKCIGTLTNVIAHGRVLNRSHSFCPVCRSQFALDHICHILRPT